MNRREFLKYAAASVAAAGVPAAGIGAVQSTISVAEGKDYAKITVDAVNALGGMKKFVKTGDVVIVKPNMGWDRKPEYAANTHPLVIKAVVEECLKAGAKKVKVFDRSCNDPRRSYENSGIAPILAGMANVDVKQIDYDRFKKVKMPNGVFLKEWDIYDEVLSANVYINVPVAKHHALAQLTLTLKNIMGVMGGNRGYLHRNIEDALSDVNIAVKTHLSILDATRILLAGGPQGGSLADVKVMNKVIASTDMVAADAYAAKLFNKEPHDIPITVTAAKRGLGEINLRNVRIIKA